MTAHARSAPRSQYNVAALTAVTLIILTIAAYAIKDTLYLAISGLADSSELVKRAGILITEPALVALVVFTGLLVVWSWLRDRSAFFRLACGGVGVVLGYAASEGIKLVVQQERPCAALEIVSAVACPETGDWSWPSNHSVIAAGFATACILAAPRLVWFLAPVAVLLGLSRVIVGVHYLHDVLAGLTLGFVAVLVCVAALYPVAMRVVPASLLPREEQQSGN